MTKTTKANGTDNSKTADAAENPFAAFQNFFQVPDFDMDFGMDGINKNMTAASEAGRALFDGAKAAMAKNIDMAKENVQELVDVTTGATTNKIPEAGFQTAADLMTKMAQRNMKAMRDTADVVIDANQKAITILQERYSSALEEMGNRPS